MPAIAGRAELVLPVWRVSSGCITASFHTLSQTLKHPNIYKRLPNWCLCKAKTTEKLSTNQKLLNDALNATHSNCCLLHSLSTEEVTFFVFSFSLAHSLKPVFLFAARNLDIKFYSNCHAEIWRNWRKRQNLVGVINNSDINSFYFTQSAR